MVVQAGRADGQAVAGVNAAPVGEAVQAIEQGSIIGNDVSAGGNTGGSAVDRQPAGRFQFAGHRQRAADGQLTGSVHAQ